MQNCLAVDKEAFVVNKFTREGVRHTDLGENLGGLGNVIYFFFFSRWHEFLSMFYETAYSKYICKYMGRGGGEGEGDEWQYIRCKIFRFSEHTKAPLCCFKGSSPHTHTNQDWNLYRNKIFSTLGWRGSALLEII
jgi:hypothetical protein